VNWLPAKELGNKSFLFKTPENPKQENHNKGKI
jgi:hypothetical protein